MTNENTIDIESGRSKQATGLQYSFSIKSDNQTLTYTTKYIPLEHVHWKGWVPFSKRMFYTQINADGKIWVLIEEVEKPITMFTDQPDGFPLEPNT